MPDIYLCQDQYCGKTFLTPIVKTDETTDLEGNKHTTTTSVCPYCNASGYSLINNKITELFKCPLNEVNKYLSEGYHVLSEKIDGNTAIVVKYSAVLEPEKSSTGAECSKRSQTTTTTAAETLVNNLPLINQTNSSGLSTSTTG